MIWVYSISVSPRPSIGRGLKWAKRRCRRGPHVLSYWRDAVVVSGFGSGLTAEEKGEWELAESFLRRREASPGAGGPATIDVDVEGAKMFPALHEFLTVDVWPDGKPRMTGSMQFFLDRGRVKVCLSDRDQRMVLFATVESLCVALEAADDALRDPKGDWRPMKDDNSRRYKR